MLDFPSLSRSLSKKLSNIIKNEKTLELANSTLALNERIKAAGDEYQQFLYDFGDATFFDGKMKVYCEFVLKWYDSIGEACFSVDIPAR